MLDDKVNAILLLVKRRLILPVHLSVSYVLQDKSEEAHPDKSYLYHIQVSTVGIIPSLTAVPIGVLCPLGA